MIAQEAKTKLVTSYHAGGRAFEDAVELLAEVESRRDKSTQLPIFTSDDWDAYKNGCSPLIVGVFISFIFIFYRQYDNKKMIEESKKNEDASGRIMIRHAPIRIAIFME